MGRTDAVTTVGRVRVQAPVRVLDAGGWTDTWFAGAGSVCHLAVGAGVDITAQMSESNPPGESGTVDLRLPAFADRYRFRLDQLPGRHALVEAVLRRWAPAPRQLAVTVASPVPPGSGVGTSASVAVALIAALRALAGDSPDPAELARCAHQIETGDLGLQSGVQDQIAAAYGGCNLVTIDPYPHAAVRPLDLPPATWDALRRRVVTVYLGSPHQSSAVHEAVISRLKTTNGEKLLAPLRTAAQDAAAALIAGDLDAYGQAMIDNTAAQAGLHPALVSRDAQQVIELARAHGAAGWKVNGAGGNGGTVSIVGPADPEALRRALESASGLHVLPLGPAPAGVSIVDG